MLNAERLANTRGNLDFLAAFAHSRRSALPGYRPVLSE